MGRHSRCIVTGDTQPARPAVIMFPPIFGVDADAKAIADRWADRGYLVAVPDYFFRTAPGVLDRSEGGRKLAMERWKALDVDRTISDMWSLKSYLLSRPCCNSEFAALGFCAGGELAFLAATRLGARRWRRSTPRMSTVISSEAGRVAGRITMHFGGNDPLVPLDKVDAVKSAFASNPRVDVAVYPGAAHGFSFAGQPSYHQVAASSSDQRAQEVLGELRRAA